MPAKLRFALVIAFGLALNGAIVVGLGWLLALGSG